MAHAPDVLREALEEADLLAHSEGSPDEVAETIRLAHDAYRAGDGDVPDEDCKILHPTRWDRLGLH